MRAAEIIRLIPGLKERQLQYWADKGYVKYNPITEGDVIRRDYAESQIPFIKRMVELTAMGLFPRKACEKVRAELLKKE